MKNKFRYLRRVLQSSSKWHGREMVFRLILFIVFFVLYTAILSTDFISNKHDYIASIEMGQVSDRDIMAPRTISYIDSVETKKLETEILEGVSDVYELDGLVMTSAEAHVREIFRVSRQALGYKTILPDNQQTDTPAGEEQIPLDVKKEILRKNMPVVLSENVLDAISVLNSSQLFSAEESINHLLHKHLRRGIRESDIDGVRRNIAEETKELNASDNEKTVIASIVDQLVKPNFIYNAEATKLKQEIALQAIEPVRKTVKKDQVLVRRGDVITAEQIHVMEELGMYSNTVDKYRILGWAMFVAIVLVIAGVYLYNFAQKVYDKLQHLLLLGFIVLLNLLLGKISGYYSDFIAPMAMGGMLAATLINARVGMVICLVSSLLFAVMGEGDLRAVAGVLTGGIIGVYSLSISPGGHSMARAGFFIGLANFGVIMATGLIAQSDIMEMLTQGLYGVIGGIGSAILATGLLPYLENTFNITSSVKLMDLAKPSHPLLQRLLFEAPGSYHHSILVGNLAESAASRVGADVNLVRVGAYYHDIGKIKRPYFFVENQMGDVNPHEKMSPTLSTLVITSHVKEGVELCQEYKLPQAVIDIVQQHHGTSLASFFYRKASEGAYGECITEADFRYEGPKPQTKEAAIIMLADCCEAAVRSVNKPTKTRIETMVRKIIKGRLDEGQLDECNLTLKDLTVIGDVYIRILSSMFHSRIEYPEELVKRKAKNEDNNKQSPEKDTADQGNTTDGETGSK